MKSKTANAKKRVGLRNSRGILFCVGDVVALTDDAFKRVDPHPDTFAGKPITKATITSLLPGRDKSVQLDKKLGGYWTWSVEELRKAKVKHAS